MNYTKIQKSVASFLLPLFFFGLVFRYPFGDFFSGAKAINPEVNSLVSILVNEDIYSGVESRVERYAEDIQKQLEKTRVVIIPVPSDASVFQIASMNENLYYEGYKGLTGEGDFESELVGSVFIGKIPVPVVFDGDKSSQTIFPYTDFEDKKYIYNHQTQKYETNSNNLGGLKAEIWHGVIVPNKGSESEDIDAINDFFDKNHDFYEGVGNFTNEKGTINGKTDEDVDSNYKPYVFYFDEFREQASLSYSKYQGYEAYLENKEDLNYSRYSKELAQSIQDRVLGAQSDQITDLMKDLDPDVTDLSALESFKSTGPDISKTSAISTRFITNNVTKKFLEVLNSSTLGDFRKDVYNAGRYNGEGAKVNVDTIAYLISILDTLGDNVIKGVNNNLEEKIDELVKGGLSRKIAVPLSISVSGGGGTSGASDGSGFQTCSAKIYTNFLYGNHGDDFNEAIDCTMYRGSTDNGGTLVEANRGYNIDNVQGDINACKAIGTSSIGKTQGYWAGNSPLGFDTSTFQSGELTLKDSNLDLSIRPLFDIKGGKKTTDKSKTPDPRNCFNNNYLVSYEEEMGLGNWNNTDDSQCVPSYQLPIDGQSALKWTCDSTNKPYEYGTGFVDNYKSVVALKNPLMSTDSCDVTNIVLGGNTVKTNLPTGYLAGVGIAAIENEGCTPIIRTYTYKAIPSFIEHKAPTVGGLGEQTNAMISPNLPIDKDRYIDFIGASGKYVKINYPYLYRVGNSLEYTGNFSEDYEKIKELINQTLQSKSAEINQVIRDNNPSSLSGEEKTIYEDYLFNGTYPDPDFGLGEFLPTESNDFIQGGDKKDISYYDTLAFAVYWSNLDSVAQKYKFIIENYLSDQFEGNANYALAKHKKSYEIAYLGAPGDAQNMYVTLDPEGKGENPYAEIVSQNLLVNSDLMSANLGLSNEDESDDDGKFNCAPPEGVPLWEWIPAVMCRLDDILPPKIKIVENKCSTKSLFDEDKKESGIYDFGQNDSDIEAGYCSDDVTGNGISDCLEEEIQNATIKLKSSTLKAGHGENITIEAGLFDSNNSAIEGVNHINTIFELVSVVVPSDPSLPFNELNSKEIYNSDILDKTSRREVSKYISFTNTQIPLSSGKASYNFSAKNKDADISVRSRVVLLDKDDKIIKELSSDETKIQIRATTFALSSKIVSGAGIIESSRLGLLPNNETNVFFHDANEESLESLKTRIANSGIAQNKLVLSLSKFDKVGDIPMSYPLTIRYLHNGNLTREDLKIESRTGVGFKPLYIFPKAGEYDITITDNEGRTVTQSFTVLSDKVSKVEVELGASDLEVNGNITNNILILKDKYGNIVQGQPYDVSMKLLRGGLVFPDNMTEGSSTKDLKIYKGIQVFRLKPTSKAASNSLRIEVKTNDTSVATTVSINTLEKIETYIDVPTDLGVGGDSHNFTLEFKDSKGAILEHFNSRVYVKINPIYGKVATPYVEIKNGIATVSMETSNVAGENIPLEFNIEGLSKIIRKNITILPSEPMKMDLVLSKSKMEASTTSSGTLKVELKDRYGNLVHNDNSTTFNIEIEENSKNNLKSAILSKKAQNGEATFELSATSNPGTSYIKVTSDPDLKQNTFTVGSGGEARIVEGVGVNTVQVKSYYFWNKDNIEGNNFNGLYSVLLGAEYGDFTQKDYLAGSLLFDRDNRSLAVTSLLNNPHGFADSIVFGRNGGAQKQSSQGDLSQDIELKVQLDQNNKLYLEVNNNATNTYIGKIYYNFGNEVYLKTCIGEGNDFANCGGGIEKTSITLKPFSDSYSVSGLDDELTLSEKNGNTLLKVNKQGSFVVNPLVNLEVDSNNMGEELVINVLFGDNIIGKVAINFENHKYVVTRSLQETQTNKKINKNSIIAEFKSYMYGTRDTYLTDGTKTLAIYYNDPFKDDKALDSFSSDSLSSPENFQTEGGIGWKNDNKFLLNFAAGKNVGESVQDYASFGSINLGDPVINLKKITETFKESTDEKSFDSTIGNLLSDEEVESYQTFDYNKDGNTDILLIKGDGYISLLENKGNSAGFLDKGDLVYIADYGKSSYVKAGDFSGDGYGDIFFVNNKGEPFLFENREKDFVRIPLKDTFDLNAKIVQVEIFNMDNDAFARQDLVTLDDAGNINIFYGNGPGETNKFTKKQISNGYGMTLNSDSRTDGALVYFDGLVQIDEQDLLNRLSVDNDALAENPVGGNDAFFDKIMFEKVNYSTGENTNDQQETIIEESLPVLDTFPAGDIGPSTSTNISVADFLEKHSGSTTVQKVNHVDSTTFIKSEYARAAGIEVDKKFNDVNGANLQSGDLVDVTVVLKNTTETPKIGVAYVDSVVSPFEMSEMKITIANKAIEREAPAGYNLLVDGIDLAAGESITIKYTLRVLPITFGDIKLGLFEEGTAGDDLYGDIIIKADNQNCSQDVDIFKSLDALREYSEKEKTAPKCDPEKLKLPGDLDKNNVDLDQNGVPDYIDAITDDLDKQKDFANDTFDEMQEDRDGDGIPDHEDDTPDFNANELGGVLGDYNESVDDMSAGIDTMIEGFGCGFGGDSCISTPMNWAPLAPGQDPTLFGTPVGDGLKVGEGIPIFSAFNGAPLVGPWGCVEVPAIWPPFVDTFDGACLGRSSAGGMLGTSSPTNFVRLFATPTLTGGFGTAACFGGPASIVAYSNPPGLSPLVPGGNCIVIAKPLASCSNDGSEGDPESLGQTTQFGGVNGFGIVNANCSPKQNNGDSTGYGSNASLDDDFAKSYYDYKQSDVKSSSFRNKYNEALDKISEGGLLARKNEKLIQGGNSGEYEFSVGLDFSGNLDGNFDDVQQIQKQRVAGFPSFLMDWATRQIEEFVTKLTDFPTLFIILPDFGGIMDSDWGEVISKGKTEAYNKGKQTEENRLENIKSQIKSINSRKSGLDCSGEDEIQCLSLDVEAGKLAVETRDSGFAGEVGGAKKAFSGIRSVYDFLGNIPMVSVKPQQVNVEIPWIDQNTLNKTLLDWELTKEQWLSQSATIQGSASISATAKSDYSRLISDLDKNIQTLEDYREIPAQLSSMFNKKEEWLGQVLCNVESISSLTGGRIDQNGKRFKAWVELYVLIKAILKSWQLLIDVFADYDAECHECKNERNDLLNYEFKLIDMIIPKIPVIKFPKWPDIILDLRNIRAGLVIKMPDFNVTQRPIVLPTLPDLQLPNFSANADASAELNFEFPQMPLLEGFDIPELPDLPGIPTVELPNLPPPPTLPKLFSSIDGIGKILKLIVKAMCILKSSPFVPEWRAGDQIAFLTERTGYLGTDFLDLSLPEFSFPFVDAIKVTTWVNFEVETDFMVEMANQIVEPINSSSSNVANKFSNAGLDSLDFSSYSQNINVSESVNLDEANANNISVGMFANMMAKGVIKIFSYIEEGQDETVSSKEFLKLVNQSLAHQSVTSDPRMTGILNLWKNVNKMTYHKEDMLIKELRKNSDEKFDALELIIENEIEKTKKLQSDLEKSITPQLFQKVVGEYKNNDFVEYDKTLSKYNKNFLESAKNLLNNGEDPEVTSIKKEGKKLLSRVNGGLDLYKQGLTDYNSYIAQEKLLASNTDTTQGETEENSCQASNNSEYSYNYKGLYIIEKDKSYRLFDYIDELGGDEEFTNIDFDSDGDTDLLYLVNGQLYLKENISIKNTTNTNSSTILKVRSEKNKFLGTEFIEAINGFRETNTDNKSINISFNAPKNPEIKHFVYEYYTTVDKFSSELLHDYNPAGISKNVVEAFVSGNEQSVEVGSSGIIEKKHPAVLSYVGDMKGIIFQTFEMIKLKTDNQTEISKGTTIYTSNKDVRIIYYDSDQVEHEKVIGKNTSLEFDDNIIISSIYSGDVYVKSDDIVILKGTEEISKYIGLPFFTESKIESIPDLRGTYSENSNIEITYASGKEPLGMTFGKMDSYEVYDLGQASTDYLIKLDAPNDFLYGKMHATHNGIKGTLTNQKLAAPQVQADKHAPELSFNETIRIPVYQYKTIDLTPFVYENSGFRSITKVEVDFNLEIDSPSSGDGDPRNDNDVE
ncbi:VCBS repeat-containing protein, partial [Candidatus Gracilibacteria bacterium]|nr:VCBS repeat-containing protein [Candidatus Gracilibacteria bacterium]